VPLFSFQSLKLKMKKKSRRAIIFHQQIFHKLYFGTAKHSQNQLPQGSSQNNLCLLLQTGCQKNFTRKEIFILNEKGP